MMQAVIFDIGGVLIRSSDTSHQRVWEQRLGLAEGRLAELVLSLDAQHGVTLGRMSSAELWRRVGQRLGLAEVDLPALQQDFWHGGYLDRELLDFLHGLRPRFKTALLSNGWDDARAGVAARFGLMDVVDEMIISAEAGLAKPDPRFFQLALTRLAVAPSAAVLVDDVAENVAVAQSLGMNAIQFQNTQQTITMVQAIIHASLRNAPSGPRPSGPA